MLLHFLKGGREMALFIEYFFILNSSDCYSFSLVFFVNTVIYPNCKIVSTEETTVVSFNGIEKNYESL